MIDEISVQVKFSANTKYGLFTDALYYSIDSWSGTNKADIDKEKQKRIDNFIYTIENPPITVEVPIEDQIKDVQDQIIALTTLKTNLETQIIKK